MGKTGWPKGRKQTKEHIEKRRKALIGKGNPNWKGGRNITNNGYIVIYYPGYRGDKKYGSSPVYAYEHILVAEKALGRFLKRGECVHHINGIKTDNRNRNLLICTLSYHRWLESKMGYLYKREHFKNI